MSNFSKKIDPRFNPLLIADFFFDGTFVEDLRSYKPGGFHPVHLGDMFSICPGSDRPRYRVLQKLGQGAFSTVWLAQDTANHDRCVALKITIADVHGSEAAILQSLSSPADNWHRGQKHVLQLLDHFQIHGPNGIHEALVTDVLVLMQYLHDFHMMDPKKTFYQTLLALTYLSEHRVVHGDLHADNILFYFPGLAELASENHSNSQPKYVVEAADITNVVESVMNKHGKEGIYAVVADFGSAFRVTDSTSRIPKPRTPPYICAPEIHIRVLYLKEGFYRPEWQLRGDIWSLGCSFYQIVAHERLFIEAKEDLLDEIIQFAGPLPQSWISCLKEKPKAYCGNDESSLRAAAEVSSRRVRLSGDTRFASPLQKETGFHVLLGSMLVVDPDSRHAPEALVQIPWFEDFHGAT